MTILYLSPVHPLLTPGRPFPRWQTQASHVRALQALGHHVEVLAYTPMDHIRVTIPERLFYNLKVALSRMKVDVIFFSLGADVLFPTTVRFLKQKLNVPLVILSGVSPVSNGNPRERGMASIADLIATNDQSHADEWKRLGATRAIVLPISAIDPELYKGPTFGTKGRTLRNIDVLFVGTVTPEREQFFQKFRKLLAPGVSFMVKHHVFEEEYAMLLRRAKIVLNPLRPEMRHGANLRLFEIPALGALELASHTSSEWLVEGKEIVTYTNAEDAARLVEYYLSHEKERKKIVQRGRERVFREHTFEKRFEKLLNLIDPSLRATRQLTGSVAISLKADCRVVREPAVGTPRNDSPVDVSICIVSFNTKEHLKKCLTLIFRFTKKISFEVIVVDNASSDGSSEMVKKEFPKVQLIKNSGNRWFSVANNQGLRRAKGPYIFFLNPDTWSTNNVIKKLYDWMERHPRVGACEPLQFDNSGKEAPTGSLLNQPLSDAIELTIFGHPFLQSSMIEKFRQKKKKRSGNWETEVISGAALFARTEAVRKVGGFQERLKLYYTDTDLCRKLMHDGWKIWHVGGYSLRHALSVSTSKLLWEKRSRIYAEDARTYYQLVGKPIQGWMLYILMRVNSFLVSFRNSLLSFRTWNV